MITHMADRMIKIILAQCLHLFQFNILLLSDCLAVALHLFNNDLLLLWQQNWRDTVLTYSCGGMSTVCESGRI